MSSQKPDYLSVVYNEFDRPLTAYPQQLTDYLCNKYNLKQNSKILDIGCVEVNF